MHVALAADGRRVAEAFGRRAHRRGDVRVADAPFAPCERPRHEDRSRPGAEVLGRDLDAGELLEVGVHVGRVDALDGARVVHVLEQRLSGQLAATAHEARHALVVDRCALRLATLAAKLEYDARARHARVPVAQRGQTEGVVGLDVALVADAQARFLEQAHQRRQHTAARQAGGAEVGAYTPPDRRKRAREELHAIELVRVALAAPRIGVAILLALARVASRGLEVAAGIEADPDVRPRGRDRQRADAIERLLRDHDPAPGVAILEPAAHGDAPDSRLRVGRIAHAGGLAAHVCSVALALRGKTSPPRHARSDCTSAATFRGSGRRTCTLVGEFTATPRTPRRASACSSTRAALSTDTSKRPAAASTLPTLVLPPRAASRPVAEMRAPSPARRAARISAASWSAIGPTTTCSPASPTRTLPRAPSRFNASTSAASRSASTRRSRVVHASTLVRLEAPPSAAM